MTRLLVLYGQPKNPAAFDRRYREVHLPLAKKMKGFRKSTIGKVTGSPGGAPSPYGYPSDLHLDS